MNTTSSRYHNDDGLDSDEEEAERLLSEQHGEAADDSAAPKRKRTTNATKLTEEDAAAAKEFEEKITKKKPRQTLQPSDLKGSNGLIFVRRSFPTSIKKFREVPHAKKVRGTGARSEKVAQRLNTNMQLNAAATFSRSLMTSYHSFAQELFPALATEDVFLKIENLGSKKEVKDYLQLMRDEMRKEYLEGVYGEEKAGRILNELEYGLKVVHPVEENHGGQLSSGDGGNVAPRMGRAVNDDDDEEGGDGTETPPASPPPMASPKRVVVANPYAKKVVEENVASPEKEADAAMAEKSPEAVQEEEEDEEEATFSDNGGESNDIDNTNEEVAKDDDLGKEDEPTEPTTEKQTDVAEANENTVEETSTGPALNENEQSESGTELSNNQENVIEAAIEKKIDADDDKDDEKVQAVEDAVAEPLTTPENDNATEAPTQVPADSLKTQETLTLMESQFDNVEMEFTLTEANERFSQVNAMVEGGTEEEKKTQVETPTQVGVSQTQDDRFSQTQDDRFSQTQGDGLSQEENMAAEERFSQFTQGTAKGPVFEEEEEEDCADGEDGASNGRDRLGQTMETQLSMEY
ncbi:hypothetical protein ACHAXR_008061 [Thalassiosira sp. AJA248-18]